MALYGKQTGEYHKSRIRAVLVVRPDASLRDIQSTLEESTEAPLTLTLHYIGKLKNKILKERINRFNANLRERLSTMQDKKMAIDIRLWSEATNQRSPAIARIAALRDLFRNELELMESEMNAGLYERKLGTVDMKHAYKISPEHQALILRAFENYGIIKDTDAEPVQLPDPRPSDTAH